MPVSSKRQFRFMKAVEGGYIHPKGLSKEKAKEFTEETSDYKALPEKSKRFAKLMKVVRKQKIEQ